jgi:fructose-specific phosphotransferase system component IIB
LTAFEEPTNTNTPIKIKTNGDMGIIKSLKKGTINDCSGIISAE